jgi:hypothetical protein
MPPQPDGSGCATRVEGWRASCWHAASADIAWPPRELEVEAGLISWADLSTISTSMAGSFISSAGAALLLLPSSTPLLQS